MAAKIQRKHPQAPAINQTLLTSLENFIEAPKNSNHKLTSLLLTDKRKDAYFPINNKGSGVLEDFFRGKTLKVIEFSFSSFIAIVSRYKIGAWRSIWVFV